MEMYHNLKSTEKKQFLQKLPQLKQFEFMLQDLYKAKHPT